MEKLILTLTLGICLSSIGRAQTTSSSLRPGDILYIDSGDGFIGACAVKFQPDTGQQTILIPHLNLPEGIAVDQQGQIIVASQSQVIRIDPETGAWGIIADIRSFGSIFGLAVDADGEIFVTYVGGKVLGPHRYDFADSNKHDPKFKPLSGVVQISSKTGKIKAVSSGDLFQYPLGMAISENGDLFVANVAFPGEIIRVSPKGGPDKLVSRGGYLHFPLGIVVSGQYAYVTDVATEDQNFGIGTIVRVDIETGEQTILSIGNLLFKPVGIAMDLSGQLVVTDPYTQNPNSQDLYDGGIVQIDPTTGEQTLLVRGHDNIVNPLAITVVR